MEPQWVSGDHPLVQLHRPLAPQIPRLWQKYGQLAVLQRVSSERVAQLGPSQQSSQRAALAHYSAAVLKQPSVETGVYRGGTSILLLKVLVESGGRCTTGACGGSAVVTPLTLCSTS